MVNNQTPGSASIIPTKPPPTVFPTPTPNPSGGVGLHVSADAFAYTPPETLARVSDLVVTGHVTQILPPQWATPDRKPPADWIAAVEADDYNGIITPVVLTLDGPPVVNHVGFNPTQKTIVVAQLGGTIGQYAVTYSGTPIFVLGEHVLVVLDRAGGPNSVRRLISTDAGPAWAVAMKYPVTAAGNALVSGTPVPETDVIARMRAAGAATSTPTP